jgi:Tfp pilus assembly protein PilV
MRKPIERTGSTSGYTLVEIMVAVVILMLGVASTIGLSKWMISATYQSKMASAATAQAQDKIEDLAKNRLSQLAGGSDTTGAFTRVWTVKGSGNLREVSATVRWRGIGGTSHQVTLNDMFTE